MMSASASGLAEDTMPKRALLSHPGFGDMGLVVRGFAIQELSLRAGLSLTAGILES